MAHSIICPMASYRCSFLCYGIAEQPRNGTINLSVVRLRVHLWHASRDDDDDKEMKEQENNDKGRRGGVDFENDDENNNDEKKIEEEKPNKGHTTFDRNSHFENDTRNYEREVRENDKNSVSSTRWSQSRACIDTRIEQYKRGALIY